MFSLWLQFEQRDKSLFNKKVIWTIIKFVMTECHRIFEFSNQMTINSRPFHWNRLFCDARNDTQVRQRSMSFEKWFFALERIEQIFDCFSASASRRTAVRAGRLIPIVICSICINYSGRKWHFSGNADVPVLLLNNELITLINSTIPDSAANTATHIPKQVNAKLFI